MSTQLKRIGILWGGGLGDLLMIRPFLKAVHSSPETESYLMTAESHLSELFDELCPPAEVIQLSRNPGHLLPVIKKWRHFFDLIYLGPCPTLKTRILGHLLAPKKLWSCRHKNADPFLLEQIIADIGALGLSGNQRACRLTDYLPWPVESSKNPFADPGHFFVLHPGAKARWSTTLWPLERWAQLVLKILGETDYSLCLVGTSNEEERLSNIAGRLPAQLSERVLLCLGWPIKKIASLVSSSSGVICHNSGILHLSAFIEKQTVCITGSSARYWRPPYPWVFNVTSGKCRQACNRYKCPVPFFRAKCINGVEVQDVWEVIRNKILKKDCDAC